MNWPKLFNAQAFKESDIHPHCPEERADLFSSFEQGSVELEVMDFLYGLVRLFKPRRIIETGTHFGISAVALGVACKQNGFGKVISIENDSVKVTNAKKLITSVGLDDYVEIVENESLKYIAQLNSPADAFDFAFLDSMTPIRAPEFILLAEKNLLNNIIAFHDSSRHREKTFVLPGEPQDEYVKAIDEIERKYCRGGIETNLSRGFRLLQLDRMPT